MTASRLFNLFAMMLCLACCVNVHAEDLWNQILTPSILQSDVDSAIASMSLDATEETNIRSIYKAFVQDFTQEATKTIAQFETARGDIPGFEKATFDWWDTSIKLVDQFESDVTAVITGEGNVKVWWRIMAAARRRYVLKEVHDVQRVRDACDLPLLLESIPLTAEEHGRVDAILDGLEHDLDQQLHAYQVERGGLFRALRGYSSRAEGADDATVMNKSEKAGKRHGELLAGVGKLDAEYAPRIAGALESPNREAFLLACDRCAFPDAFQPGPAELAVEAIRFAPDIAAEKRAAIEAIFAEYVPARDQLTQDAINVVRRWQADQVPQKKQMEREGASLQERHQRQEIADEEYFQALSDFDSQHPAVPILYRRHNLVIDTVRRMCGVFSEDEFQKLPFAVCLALADW